MSKIVIVLLTIFVFCTYAKANLSCKHLFGVIPPNKTKIYSMQGLESTSLEIERLINRGNRLYLGDLKAPADLVLAVASLQNSRAYPTKIYSPVFEGRNGQSQFYRGIALHEYGHLIYALNRPHLTKSNQNVNPLAKLIHEGLDELFADSVSVIFLANQRVIRDELRHAQLREGIKEGWLSEADKQELQENTPEYDLRSFHETHSVAKVSQFQAEHTLFSPTRSFIGDILSRYPTRRIIFLPSLFKATIEFTEYLESPDMDWLVLSNDQQKIIEFVNGKFQFFLNKHLNLSPWLKQ